MSPSALRESLALLTERLRLRQAVRRRFDKALAYGLTGPRREEAEAWRGRFSPHAPPPAGAAEPATAGWAKPRSDAPIIDGSDPNAAWLGSSGPRGESRGGVEGPPPDNPPPDTPPEPDTAAGWFALGVAQDEAGHYPAALESCDRALALAPDLVEAWYNRGVALNHLGRYEAALESYDKALALKPDLVEAWSNRGVALGRLGRYEAALESHDKALALKPDLVKAWSNRGVAYERLGDEARARYCLQTEARVRAVLSGTANADQYRQVARDAYCHYGHWETARACLERVFETEPEHLFVRLLLAEIELEEGNMAAAEAGLAWVLDWYPDWIEAQAVAARLLLARGEWEAAREKLRVYYDRYGDNLDQRESYRWLDWFEQVEDGEYADTVCDRLIRLDEADWYPRYRQARVAWGLRENIERCEGLLEELTEGWAGGGAQGLGTGRGEGEAAVVLLHGELALACGDLPCARRAAALLEEMDTGGLSEADVARWRAPRAGLRGAGG